MSPDLRHAQVFVSELGRDLPRDTTMSALDRAGGFLAGYVARKMNLKYAPRLSFVPDESFANAAHLDQLINQARSRAD
ncbi:MAG: 30S ribosome-binding factor RbfA, partial [Pseudomonadota bacterium]